MELLIGIFIGFILGQLSVCFYLHSKKKLDEELKLNNFDEMLKELKAKGH